MNPFDKYLSAEDIEHRAVANYLNGLQLKDPTLLWWHTPNEGKKSPYERFKSAILGIKSGVPDFFIARPKFIAGDFIFGGLFIELKASKEVISPVRQNVSVKSGKLSDNQRVMIEKLNASQYMAVVCYNRDEAINCIDEYLAPE